MPSIVVKKTLSRSKKKFFPSKDKNLPGKILPDKIATICAAIGTYYIC